MADVDQRSEDDKLADQFPVVDPLTGRRYSSEWAMNLSRRIEADRNPVRRALRRWISGV